MSIISSHMNLILMIVSACNSILYNICYFTSAACVLFFYYRLYKSLEDYDVLHGIFTNLDGTKDVTRKALESEERGDYLTALSLYKKVCVCVCLIDNHYYLSLSFPGN